MSYRRILLFLVAASLLLLHPVVAQEPDPVESSLDSIQHEQRENAGDIVDTIQEQDSSVNRDEEAPVRPGKWGTGVSVGDEEAERLTDAKESSSSVPVIDDEETNAVADSPQGATATSNIPSEEMKNDTSKRHWGQMLNPDKETESESTNHRSGVSPQQGNRQIPIIGKRRDRSSSNTFPEGFILSARVFTGRDGLAHFDNDEDISLPYIYCGADGSTTAALSVHTATFREAIAAPTVWNAGDLRPTLVVALRAFRMKLDSGEEQLFQPGDVVLLEDTIRSGHQMIVSDHRDLVVMFVTLQRRHEEIGKEHLSIKRANLQRRSCEDDKGNGSADIATRLQSLEWDGRRTRTVILGIVSLSLSTLAADFLAKVAPLWLAVGIGGTFFVASATFGLTVLMETVLTKNHLRAVRQDFDNRRQRTESD